MPDLARPRSAGPGPVPSPTPRRAHAADVSGGRPRLIALVPAHNEQERIAAAIAGLHAQTRRPDLVVVVADNCTDATGRIAREAGAEVFETRGNKHNKAGALNQAIDWALPHLHERDLVLVQDADTVLSPWFAETAANTFNRRVGAVGGVFYGEQGGGLLGLLQRMEFHRYAWEIERKGGKASVLTGTGTMFRARVLREIRAARREGRIGGGNLRDYGWTRVTARCFVQQFMMGFGAISFLVYLAFMTLTLTTYGWPGLSPFWTGIGLVFLAEKVVSVRRAGRRAIVVAALMVPEMLYDLFQHAVYFTSLWGLLRRSEEKWIAT